MATFCFFFIDVQFSLFVLHHFISLSPVLFCTGFFPFIQLHHFFSRLHAVLPQLFFLFGSNFVNFLILTSVPDCFGF